MTSEKVSEKILLCNKFILVRILLIHHMVCYHSNSVISSTIKHMVQSIQIQVMIILHSLPQQALFHFRLLV